MADPTKLSALTELAAGPAEGDEIYIRDVSEAAADESKRITAVELLNPENFTELSAGPAETDNIFIDDGGTGKKITAVELLNPENFTALSAGPAATDEVFINDGGTGKKIAASELLNPENFTAVTLPAATDELFINDGGTGKKITHDDLLFGANGTPSTQAHDDAAAIGTALDAARSDHKHAMPAAGGGGGGGGGALSREGGNTCEATNATATIGDLLIISSLTIAVGVPVRTEAIVRRTTGAASGSLISCKYNTTVINHDTAVWTAAADLADSGLYIHECIYGKANYLFAQNQKIFAENFEGVSPRRPATAMPILPTAELTDIIIRAAGANAAITVGIDEGHTYIKAVA